MTAHTQPNGLLSTKDHLDECLTRQQRLKSINAVLLTALKRLVMYDGSTGRVGPLHRAAQNKNPGIAGEAQRLIDCAQHAIKAATSAT